MWSVSQKKGNSKRKCINIIEKRFKIFLFGKRHLCANYLPINAVNFITHASFRLLVFYC